MENLPPELFLTVLGKLDKLNEILKLRLVSRKLKHLVDAYKLRSVVLVSSCYSCFIKSNPKPIDREILFQTTNARQLICALSSSVFRGLKYLSVSPEISYLKFDIEKLNHLVSLQRLDIYWLDAPVREKRLNLPSLTVLLVNRAKEVTLGRRFVEINAPKLKVLHQPHLTSAIRILHPQSVRTLWIDKLYEAEPRLDLLAKFKNLEIYQQSCLHYSTDIDVWSALNPNLEQLRFLGTFLHTDSLFNSQANYESTVLNYLMARKAVIGRSQTKVFFANIPLIDDKSYDSQGFKESNLLGFSDYYKNNHLLLI